MNDALATYSGKIVDISQEENVTRTYVTGEGGIEETVVFMIPNRLLEGMHIDDDVIVYYDRSALREDSLPPHQYGVEKIEKIN